VSAITRALLIAALVLALVGAAKASVEEGVISYQRGDFAAALKILEPEAKAGDATARFHLGLMYDFGEGVDNDFAEAARWYRKAAEQGHGDAQYNIGVLYYTGKGLPKDVAEAARWFKIAANRGNVFAQNNMGTLSAEGQVPGLSRSTGPAHDPGTGCRGNAKGGRLAGRAAVARPAWRDNLAAVFDTDRHRDLVAQGVWRLSLEALLAALFINLYRDEPAFQSPFRLLSRLMDIDETLTTWSYRHAVMAQRMIGRKVGTGGSSGHDYLRRTAEQHRVFSDLFALSTYSIPRSQLPELPEPVRRAMNARYSSDAP
jgi:hypothetical protein